MFPSPTDVAEVCGWKDTHTLIACYQQADLDTMEAVVSDTKPVRRMA